MDTSTRKTYQSALEQFISWGGYIPCKPRMVLDYVKDRGAINKEGRLKAKSLRTHLAAISKRHTSAGFIDPTNKPEINDYLKELSSIERQMHIHADESRYITPEEGCRLISHLCSLGGTVKERRDRLIVAMLMMLGHRAGHVALLKTDNVYNLGIPKTNIHLDIKPYKTSKSYKVTIPYTGELFCPATWLRDYVDEQGVDAGYLFKSLQAKSDKPLTRQSINTIAKAAFEASGIMGGKLTANSFRKTIATLSALEGVDSLEIAAHGGWTSVETINQNYLSKIIGLNGSVPEALLRSFKKADLALTNDSFGTHSLMIKGKEVELTNSELSDIVKQIQKLQESNLISTF